MKLDPNITFPSGLDVVCEICPTVSRQEDMREVTRNVWFCKECADSLYPLPEEETLEDKYGY